MRTTNASVSLPRRLAKQVERLASADGKTLEQWVLWVVRAAAQQREALDALVGQLPGDGTVKDAEAALAALDRLQGPTKRVRSKVGSTRATRARASARKAE